MQRILLIIIYTLSRLTGYNLKYEKGKVSIDSEKTTEQKEKVISPELKKLVFDLVEGEKRIMRSFLN